MASARDKRNVFVLALCQVLFNTGRALMFVSSPIIGYAIADEKWLATAPITLMLVGTAAGTLPAAHLMGVIGRRAGFVIGSLVGGVGGAAAFVGLMQSSFLIFCLGALLFGFYSGFAQQYRFAAADAAPESFKSKAISLVLAGGVIAAFTGPELAKYSREWLGSIEFLGSFAALIVVTLASAVIVLFVDIPKLTRAEAAGPKRPMAEILRDPTFVVAATTAFAGYVVMNLLMTATPLAMQHGAHHQFNDTAFVIEWHVVAMFGPGFFTGALINRFGTLRVISAGNLLLIGAIVAALSGQGVSQFWVALFLLGAGWNFTFTGGSTLLTECHTPAERAKVQGANDFIIFTGMAGASLLSGALYYFLGWTWVNLSTLPLIAASILAVFWLAYLKRRGALASAPEPAE